MINDGNSNGDVFAAENKGVLILSRFRFQRVLVDEAINSVAAMVLI